MNPIIETKELTHIYSRGTPFERVALDSVNFSVNPGEFMGIIGHTGSGKSTLIQHLNGLLKPTGGQVLFDGTDIWSDKHFTRQVRFKVGLVFQYPEYQLFEETVYADIAFGPKNMGLSKIEIDERVREAAGFVGVAEELFDKSPLELSGGQKRRIAIAGVIAMRPEVLILDEPTAGLDPAGCRQIMDNICRYKQESGATVLIVSHNMDDAARLCERLIVFDHGHLAMDGTPEQVFSRPEELIRIGLNVPQATAIAMALRSRGLELDGAVYTHEQLLAAILKAKEAAVC